MLTDDERLAIEREVEDCAHKREACVGALRVIQRSRGWVSDDHLRVLADMLDMTPEELDSVATFYPLIFRRPVGRHVILVCDSASCWVMGYEDLLRHLQSRLGVGLGGTTSDGRFTFLPVACLGACDHAPSMMVDDELHMDLTKEKINDILQRYA